MLPQTFRNARNWVEPSVRLTSTIFESACLTVAMCESATALSLRMSATNMTLPITFRFASRCIGTDEQTYFNTTMIIAWFVPISANARMFQEGTDMKRMG